MASQVLNDITINNNSAATITPPEPEGIFTIWAQHSDLAYAACSIAFSTTVPLMHPLSGGERFKTMLGGGMLGGTSGQSGMLTVSCHDGKIYINNRLGASVTFGYQILT